MASTLRIRDSGTLKVLQTLNMSITAGIHEEQGADPHGKGPQTVADVAIENEFGGPDLPARPWLRGWADGPKAKRAVQAIKRELTTMVIAQNFAPGAMQGVTDEILKSVEAQFLQGQLKPANAARTLAEKAPETRPLVGSTGQLVGALRARLAATVAGWNYEAKP